jgi:predicted CoA-binding protein
VADADGVDFVRPGSYAISHDPQRKGNPMNVAVLGASNKPARYSNQAVLLLSEKGHTVFPVHPALAEIDGHLVFKRLSDIPVPVDTVTMYVSPAHSTGLANEILGAHPRRAIFNPGTENPELEAKLAEGGIDVLHACTLVMLRTDQFGEPHAKDPV